MRKPLAIALLLVFLGLPFAFGQAGTALSNLALGNAISATDLFYDVQSVGVGGVRVTAAQIKTFVLANSLTVAVRSSSASSVTASAATDYFLCLDPNSNAITVTLPAGQLGLTFLIKDCTGHALTNNITVSPGVGNIDGSATFVMNANFQSIAVTYTGAQWSIN